MYCPKCSQEQVSDEMRFCSRCGFSLIAVKDLVASDNALVKQEAEMQAPQVSCGQRGARRAAWMLLSSLAIALFMGFLLTLDDDFADFAVFLLLPFLLFISGIALLFYSVFIADKRAARKKEAASQAYVAPSMPGQLGTASRAPELYPPRMAPIESFTGKKPQTAEMVRPPSVTENTTRLLDE